MNRSIDDIVGMLKPYYDGPAIGVEEMDDAIAEAAVERTERCWGRCRNVTRRAMTKGLDTNVLLRLVVADEPEQTRAAELAVRKAAEAGTPLPVNLMVLCEFAWVLRRSYGYSKAEIADCITRLADSPALAFQEPALVADAVQWLRRGGDFADGVIAGLNRGLGADTTLTFDKSALRLDGFDAVA